MRSEIVLAITFYAHDNVGRRNEGQHSVGLIKNGNVTVLFDD